MDSSHLPFIVFFVFIVIFLAVPLIMLRNFKLLITRTLNSAEGKAQLEKMLASVNNEGKPGIKTFISVTKTDNKGTISKSFETEDINPSSLIKEIVNLAGKSSETQLGDSKINQSNDTGFEIVENKGKNGIID